jgi:hypothetical protein
MKRWLALGFALGCVQMCAWSKPPLKSDETVMMPLALAWPAPEGQGWRAELGFWVFELEPRLATLTALECSLRLAGVDLTKDERGTLRERARWFCVDSERRKNLSGRAGAGFYALNPTEPNGWSHTEIALSGLAGPTTAQAPRKPHLTTWELTARDDPDNTAGVGDLWVVPAEGVSVISDIDDTIKVSEVRNRRRMLRRTFAEPAEAVVGMAELYANWNASGDVAFHYVSGSPWALYPVLEGFCRSNGFPRGSFHFRVFRWRKEPLQEFLGPTEVHKRPVIEELLARWPRREFILVGDSGETDPEIYGNVARQHPIQIRRILIRDVTNEPRECPRYQEAFAGLPESLWQIFKNPDQVKFPEQKPRQP